LTVRIGAAVLVGAAWCAGARAEPAPVVPVTIEVTPLNSSDIPTVADAAGSSVGQALPPAGDTAGTAIPLPPGVMAGLIGLASAAVARRRYLKRR
jgi:hypothetical protein